MFPSDVVLSESKVELTLYDRTGNGCCQHFVECKVSLNVRFFIVMYEVEIVYEADFTLFL